jgi:A/G-specific adenine glycosylase
MLGTSNRALKKQGQSPFLTKKRGISNSQITEPIWQLTGISVVDNPDLVWIDRDQLDSATLSGPHKRWIQEILQKDQLELL